MAMLIGRNRTLLGGGRKDSGFVFNPLLAVFTAKMAKRDDGFMVQGKYDGSGTCDLLTFPRGDQVVGDWYATQDPYQVTALILWKPEKDRDATAEDENIFRYGNTFYLVYENDNALLRFTIGSVTVTASLTTVAGTEYFLVLRANQNNKLNGTNYGCISINDSHTFADTVSGYSIPSATCYIGSTLASTKPANAHLKWLAIYRGIWSDGDGNGTSAGQYEDEIAACYNSGTPVAPWTIRSEDLCFAFPTDGSDGELASGTGEACQWPWQDNIPNHFPLEDGFYGGGQWATVFNGTTTAITHSDDAGYQDLADNAFTAEAWVRADGTGEGGGYGIIMAKADALLTTGWHLRTEPSFGVRAFVTCATTDAQSIPENIPAQPITSIADGKWHHITMYFDDAGDRKIYLAVDGVWVTSWQNQTAGVGAILTDAGEDLFIGSNDAPGTRTFDGAIGWYRISDNDRYTHGTDFVPARTPPASDGNTVLLVHMNEGTGVTVDNEEGTAARDGTISNGTWEQQWDQVGSPVVPYSVEFDGADTTIIIPDAASIQDIQDGVLTAEAYICFDGSTTQWAFHKGDGAETKGFFLRLTAAALRATVACATTNATSLVITDDVADNKVHHVVMVFDDAGDRKIYIAIDGIWSSYSTQTAGVGLIGSDVGFDLYLGSSISYNNVSGRMSFARFSDIARYTPGTNFIPPSRLNPPATDGNAKAQYNFRDGAGTTLLDETANNNDGTIANGVWNITPDMSVDAPGEQLYGAGGYDFGADAVDEGFSQQIRNYAANGTFASDALWDKETGWSIAAGVASCDGSQVSSADLSQDADSQDNGGVKIGIAYRFTYTISNYVAGSVRARIGNFGTAQTANGTYSETIVASTTTIKLVADALFDGDIDNVQVVVANLVCLPVIGYERDYQARPYINVYDDDNTALIVKHDLPWLVGTHDGGNDEDSLQDSSAPRWPQSLVGGTVYNITDGSNGEILQINNFDTTEKVANGDFAAGDTLWTKGTGWSIAAGIVSCDGSQTGNTTMYQVVSDQDNGGIVRDQYYKISFTVSNYSAGNVWMVIGLSGTQRSANGTFEEVIQAANSNIVGIRGDADFVGDIDDVSVILVPGVYAELSGGTDDDWDNADEYRIVPPTNWVYMESFCFELPAGCSNYTVSVLNDLDEGAIYTHQLQVLPITNDNGGMEGTYDDESGGGGGTVNVAPGWDSHAVETDGTDTLDESADAHSGSKSQQINVDNTTEGIKTATNIFAATNKWLLITAWFKRTSGSIKVFNGNYDIIHVTVTPTAGVWTCYSWIVKSTRSDKLYITSSTGGSNLLVDDVSVIELDDTTITATARTLANSTNADGSIDVDGLDELYQDIPAGVLGATSGSVEFKWTPRRSGDDFLGGEVLTPRLAEIYKDSNNRLVVQLQTDDDLRLISIVGGSIQVDAYDASAIVAGTEYLVKVEYNATTCNLLIDGVIVATTSDTFDFGANIPDRLYIGCAEGGTLQADAAFR